MCACVYIGLNQIKCDGALALARMSNITYLGCAYNEISNMGVTALADHAKLGNARDALHGSPSVSFFSSPLPLSFLSSPACVSIVPHQCKIVHSFVFIEYSVFRAPTPTFFCV